MTRYALLCGSAPKDYRQKKLEDIHNELLNKGDSHVMAFANGIDELMLEYALNNILDGNAGEKASGARDVSVLLYFCARTPEELRAKMADADCDVVRLGENEIRRDVIAYYADLAKKCDVDFQVLYDSDRKMVSEESLGYEELSEDEEQEFITKIHDGAIRIG